MPPHRRIAAGHTVLAFFAFAALALWLVPWGSGTAEVAVTPDQLFDAEQMATAESYAARARAWGWTSLAVSLAVAAILGFTRLGRRLVDRLPGARGTRVLLAVVVFVSAQTAATLGFRIGSWRLRREVGLSVQGWSGFLRDVAISWALEVAAMAAVALVVVLMARRLPRTWPVIAGGLAAAAVLGVSFVHPAVVEPLYNEFASLPEGELRERIAEVAEQEGVAIDDVVVADASTRTTTLNAWVSGFGETRRIVLYDNLVEEVAQDEVMVVVAHELAHAKHDDVLAGTALGALGAFAAVGLLGLLLSRRGGESVADPRAVPLVLACLAFGTQLVAPVENGISRAVERRADVVALCATQDSAAFETVQVRLALRSLSDPTPPRWSQWWWGSHPTTLERVALARSLPADPGSVECDD